MSELKQKKTKDTLGKKRFSCKNNGDQDDLISMGSRFEVRVRAKTVVGAAETGIGH